MRKTRLGMYSLAVGAFAMAITGCGGKKDESADNTAAPAAGGRNRYHLDADVIPLSHEISAGRDLFTALVLSRRQAACGSVGCRGR